MATRRTQSGSGKQEDIEKTLPRVVEKFGPVLLALLLAGAATAPALASAATLRVGPGMPYTTPSAAAAVARDGDVIEIAAGTYRDVAIWRANDLTIRGIGPARAHLDAAGLTIQNGKAIWVIQGRNTTVENIEFSGASVPDANGAGIRQEGEGLTVRGCYFHDNQNGILAGDNANSDILIEYSEFARNGAGDGYSHNMYINHVRSFTLRYSYSHAARVGHLVKSRAFTTYLLYNRITGEDGTSSYEIDLPNGGLAFVIGNQIQQGSTSMNSTIVSFAAEGATNPMQQFYFVNNTVVNERSAGAIFVRIGGAPMARVVNNFFVGVGTPVMGMATMASNVTSASPGFVDQAGFDYHLSAGSPAIDMGTDPGSVGSYTLAPAFQYVHPTASEPRAVVGSAIDVGAFEFGNALGPVDAGVDAAARDASTAADAATDDASAGDAIGNSSDGSSVGDDAAMRDVGADGGAGSTREGCRCSAPGRARGHGAGALAPGVTVLLARRRRRSLA